MAILNHESSSTRFGEVVSQYTKSSQRNEQEETRQLGSVKCNDYDAPDLTDTDSNEYSSECSEKSELDYKSRFYSSSHIKYTNRNYTSSSAESPLSNLNSAPSSASSVGSITGLIKQDFPSSGSAMDYSSSSGRSSSFCSSSSSSVAVNEAFGSLFINDINMGRQTVMEYIVRVIANMLIAKFPIDECCNNRNNLIINNLINFIKKVLFRSRINLNQFLVSSIYLFRVSDRLNKEKMSFKNSGNKLCLRRLFITCLVASSKHYNRLSVEHLSYGNVSESVKQRILNQNLNTQVWSKISGLTTESLVKMERELNHFIDSNFKVSNEELVKFKTKLGGLVKLIIKSDEA